MIVMSSLGLSAQSRSVFVSTQGDDSQGTGSAEAPYATITRAVEAVDGSEGSTIYVDGGLYRMTQTVQIRGQKDLSIKAVPGESPILTGADPLIGWRRVTDRKVLGRVGREVRKSLYEVNLAPLGITDLGDAINERNHPDLFYNDDAQILSRWPNEGFATGGRALGSTLIPPVANGNSGAKEPVFEYLDSRIDRWAEEADPKIGGYFFYDWDHHYYNITKVDPTAHSLTVDRGHSFRHGLRYYGLNLLCELDEPGEWYLDRQTSCLYWCPPAGVNPNNADVTLSVFRAKYMLQVEDCDSLTIEGLTLEQTRGSGISVKGGSKVTLQDCRFTNLAQNAVHIEGGYGHRVDGCLFEHLGARGVTLIGGDRRTLTSCDAEISNCIFDDFTRFTRVYNPAIRSNAVGLHIHHNEFRNAPSSAFSLGGNDIVCEFNLIERVCTESDDQGGFDLYLDPSMRGIVMRYNHWRDIVGGTRYGVGAVRLDDLITGVQIYGNVFENCGAIEFGAVQIHGGSENTVEDNLFYHCPYAVSFTAYGDSLWHETYDSIYAQMYEDVDMGSPKYLLRYPEIREFGHNIDVNIIRNNLIVDCPHKYFNGGEYSSGTPQIESNNVEVPEAAKPLEYYCSPEYLHPLGIKTIPIDEMHNCHNQWKIKVY